MCTNFYLPHAEMSRADTFKIYFLLVIEEESDIQLFAQSLGVVSVILV